MATVRLFLLAGLCAAAAGSRAKCSGNKYDYIVVGAGPAGSIVAAQLSKDRRNRVLLVEEGTFSKFNPAVDDASAWFALGSDPLVEKGYQTVPQPQLGGRVLRQPRARITGGCGSHNAMVYILGNEKDFDERWAVAGWAWRDLQPYWRHIEDTYRSETLNASEFFMREFIAAAEHNNFTFSPDPNDFELNRGKNFVHARVYGAQRLSETYVQRESAWMAYMEPVLDGSRSNLDVLVDTRVDKVLFRGKTAVGVATTNRGTGRQRNFYAAKEVVVSAGAYDTPKLLMLSGVGDCPALRAEHGIGCHAHVPGVGQNLEDHTFSVLWSPPLKDQEQAIPPADFGGYGAIAHQADGAYYHGYTVGANFVDFTTKCIGIFIEPFHYTARGNVTLRSSDPAAAPLINPNYHGTPEDEAKYVTAFRAARDLLYTPNLTPLFEAAENEVAPGWRVQTDEEIVAWGNQYITGDHHPGGTCKMATDFASDSMAVVDNRLRVRGTKNLRVVDASIVPEVVSGNPNQITMIIAFKAADIILQDQRR